MQLPDDFKARLKHAQEKELSSQDFIKRMLSYIEKIQSEN